MFEKVSSPQIKGKGYVYRLAKHYQSEYRLSYAAALAKAKTELGISVLPQTKPQS